MALRSSLVLELLFLLCQPYTMTGIDGKRFVAALVCFVCIAECSFPVRTAMGGWPAKASFRHCKTADSSSAVVVAESNDVHEFGYFDGDPYKETV